MSSGSIFETWKNVVHSLWFGWRKWSVLSADISTRGWQSLSLAYRTQIHIAEYEHLTIITTAFLNSCSDLLHLLFGQLWNVTDAFIHSQLCWWADLSPGLLLRSVGESYKEITSASLSHLEGGYFQLEEFQNDAWCSLKHLCMISLINTNAVCDFRFWCLWNINIYFMASQLCKTFSSSHSFSSFLALFSLSSFNFLSPCCFCSAAKV